MNTNAKNDGCLYRLVIVLLLVAQLNSTILVGASTIINDQATSNSDISSDQTDSFFTPHIQDIPTDFYYGTLVMQAQVIVDDRSMNIFNKYERLLAIKEEISHGLPNYEACQALEAVNDIILETRQRLPLKLRARLLFEDYALYAIPGIVILGGGLLFATNLFKPAKPAQDVHRPDESILYKALVTDGKGAEIAVMLPIVKALIAGEVPKYLGPNPTWVTQNNTQQQFVTQYFSPEQKNEVQEKYSKTELEGWASDSDAELNKILKDNNFNPLFEPFKPSEFGLLSILKVAVQWLHKGEKDIITTDDGQRYQAAKLKKGFEVLTSAKTPNPVIKINTKSKDVVYITLADNKDLKGFALIAKIDELRKDLQGPTDDYQFIKFPTVNMTITEELTWMQGMSTGKNRISKAVQQTKFTMDEVGAEVQSAAAITVEKSAGLSDKSITIDKPFYVWMEREGCTIPIMYAVSNPAHWTLQKN